MDLDEEDISDTQYDIFSNITAWSTHIRKNNKALQVIHVNIRSLRKYFCQLLVLLNNCIDAIDIVILTEANVKEEYLPMYNIPNFTMHANTRLHKGGGGILIYVKDYIKYTACNMKFISTECVHMTISINNSSIQVIAVYRPPDKSKKVFCGEIDNILRNQPANDSVILAGDCNINIDSLECPESARYLDVMSKHGLQRGIRSTTRAEIRKGQLVTSCLDHIFVRISCSRVELSAYTLITKLADHYLTGLTLGFDMQEETRRCAKTILCENLIRTKLDSTNWLNLLDMDCPLLIYENICQIFNTIYKSSKIEIDTLPHRKTQPWVDKSLLKLIENKDYLFKKWKSNPTSMNLRLEYTKARNKTNKLINIARNNFRRQEINNCKGDFRKIWQNINSWLGRKKPSIDKLINKHLCQNQDINTVCNKFCETFTNEIDTIKHNCTHVFLERSAYVSSSDCTFLYNKVSAKDIVKLINKLDSNKSPGSDGIRMKDIKYIKDKISPVIAKFINLSVRNSTYPDELKLSIIRPIYKQGKHTEFTNYRPIAILNSLNKITEKVIVSQITNFLEKNNILSQKQHGFRRNRSTVTALQQFTDDVNDYLNERKQVVAVFIDFKKAFDTLDHGGLLRAMQECGIRGYVNDWFREYLNERHMKVVIDSKQSIRGNIKYGVPTGSVYGPVGYIMHVNSVTNVIKYCKSYMYADDMCLLYGDRNIKEIELKIQEDFNNIGKWAHDNGIIININKTKIIRLYSPYNKNRHSTIHIVGHSYNCFHNNIVQCDCAYLEEATQIKYLGLTIDNNFSWKVHINNVCNKLRIVLGKFYQLDKILNRGTLYVVYHALVEAIISYGLSCYGLTFPTYLQLVQNQQLRILKRLVSKQIKNSLDKEYDKLFKICKILPVKTKVNYLILLEQFKNNTFKEIKTYSSEPRATRPKLKVHYRKNNYYGTRTRKWIVPRLCNDLPAEFEDGFRTKSGFKAALKKLLLDRMT